jgi:hypothetical protein
MNTRSMIVLRSVGNQPRGVDHGVGSEGTYAMYGIMNGGTMWGMESSWLVICIFMLLGVAGLFAYLFFPRR